MCCITLFPSSYHEISDNQWKKWYIVLILFTRNDIIQAVHLVHNIFHSKDTICHLIWMNRQLHEFNSVCKHHKINFTNLQQPCASTITFWVTNKKSHRLLNSQTINIKVNNCIHHLPRLWCNSSMMFAGDECTIVWLWQKVWK